MYINICITEFYTIFYISSNFFNIFNLFLNNFYNSGQRLTLINRSDYNSKTVVLRARVRPFEMC